MDRSERAHDQERTSWGIMTMARTVGHLCWFDRRTSAVLASWSRSTRDDAVAVAFAEQARQRAWHAELWFARLPELAELPAEPLVVPASAEIDQLADALERLGEADGADGADGTVGVGAPGDGGSGPAEVSDPASVAVRLAALARVVLPHQVSAIGRVAARSRTASDRSLARTAELVRRDLLEHWEVLVALLDARLTRGEPDVRVALPAELARHQAHLEGLLVAAGGTTGPR